MGNISYPARINKYLAHNGFATRRGADELIELGKVTLNGRRAVFGDRVNEDDIVEVKNDKHVEHVYYAYNKPKGIITHSPGEDETSIEDNVRGRIREAVFPIGRLDKATRGLILLTDDGRITEKLLSPALAHEKEYFVKVDKPINSRFLKDIESGVLIEGYTTKPAVAKKLSEDRFALTITEGKKHQIRRMCAALGYVVKDIERVRIMNITLGSLRPGDFRKIEGVELNDLLVSLS